MTLQSETNTRSDCANFSVLWSDNYGKTNSAV